MMKLTHSKITLVLKSINFFTGKSVCPKGSNCVDTIGSYRCACNSCFLKVANVFQDINEYGITGKHLFFFRCAFQAAARFPTPSKILK